MDKPSRIKNNNRRNPLLTGLLTALLGLTLAACDNVPTETTVDTGSGGGSALSYTGPACGTNPTDPTAVVDPATISDTCNFKVEFWDKMPSVSQCANCHTAANGRSPYFMDGANVNVAYGQMLSFGLVNEADIANSTILGKIRNGHNCGDATACAALATIVEGYLNNWLSGGTTGGGSGTSNEIVLDVPAINDPGQSKALPSAPGNFATTVWPLLAENCTNCHREAAPIPQAPFFAEGDYLVPTAADIDASYAAIVASQKINLDDPASSRLVVRLRQEAHHCWDPNATGFTNCADSADAMEAAINTFAGTVPLDTVDSRWVVSKAMKLSDGQIASGGARDDSSTIALYKFQSGAGSKTILDISGVGTKLDLDLYGTEDVDYKWVGGWGIEFITPIGKAQGTVQASSKLRDYITASGEYSIEAWVVPGNVTQGDANDPARIISYSAGAQDRNFTMGQAAYRYDFMNRSTSTDDNGEPALLTDDADEDLQATQQHVVLTFSPATGRKVYVNGVDVSLDDNAGAGSADPVSPAGSLSNWDETFAFILGNEASNNKAWAGKLRLVAIHNRAMTQTQITQNFDAGVGEKFFLLFSVSEQMQASNPSCIVAGVHQCFIYFVVSQFDSYSYLFNKPTFVSLNPAFTPNGTVVKGLRIGLNGKEPAVGQAFANLDTTIGATGYNSTTKKQVLSNLGTIIALEKGADNDEFFLNFETLDTSTDSGAHDPVICVTGVTCIPTVQIGTPVSDIGLRTFDEINATMSAVTGMPTTTAAVQTTFDRIKQQLPTTEDIKTFLSAHEIGISQLAIEYCSALVNDTTARAAYFPGFNFTADANAVSDADWSNLVITPLMNRIVGLNLLTQPDSATVSAELLALINNPADVRTDGGVTDGKPDGLAKCNGVCPAGRTELVVKATCAAMLGSAVSLIQ